MTICSEPLLSLQYFAFVMILALAEIGIATAGLITRNQVPSYAESMWTALYNDHNSGWSTLSLFEEWV